MGVVWRAYDERLGRDVAVKRLHARAGLDPAEAEVWSHRAMREARITARLHHPHAVPVFDVVEHDGQPCLVMQYFPSRSLAELLAERGRMPVPEVARIGAEVASALAAAHRAGIVHRDVKPANVLIAPDGTARITDFGIAHALGDVSLTTTGMVTGTPAYLAPEVARGGDASPASDVFSLGSTLYTALEGRPPFGTSENAMALLHLVASGDVVPPQHAGDLGPLLLRMLTADPASRPTMDEVAAQLSAPGTRPTRRRRWRRRRTTRRPRRASLPRRPRPCRRGEAGGLDLLWPPRGDQPPGRDEPPPATSAAREGTPPPGAGTGAAAAGAVCSSCWGSLAVAAALGFELPALRDDREGAAEPTTAATAPGERDARRRRPRAPPPSSAPPTPTPTPHAPRPRRRGAPASSAPPGVGDPDRRAARRCGDGLLRPAARRPRRRVGPPDPALPDAPPRRTAAPSGPSGATSTASGPPTSTGRRPAP